LIQNAFLFLKSSTESEAASCNFWPLMLAHLLPQKETQKQTFLF